MPELAWQPSLLDGGGIGVDSRFTGVRRLVLDDESWVEHVPGWLSGGDQLFELLLAAGEWKQRRRWMYDKEIAEPRLTAGFEVGRPACTARARLAQALADVGTEDVEDLVPGGDAGTPSDALRMPSILGTVCDVLSERYGVAFDRVWVNLYRNGSDSVAWHGDRNARVLLNPLVATVSLGAQRKFQLRRAGETKVLHELRPGPGDLIVMGGACQTVWQHSVPKTRQAVGPRMSVTIRHSTGDALPPPEGDDLSATAGPGESPAHA